MIDKLTKNQESLLYVYRDKWLKIGLSTKRINRSDAIKRWHKFDKEILGNTQDVPVIFMDSPLSTWIATLYLFNLLYGKIESILQVESQVRSQVGSQVRSQVRSQVGSQVESQVRSQVGSQVESQVWSQVGSQVRSQVESQVESFIYPYLNNLCWAGYYGFYDFMNKELGIVFNKQKEWNLLMTLKDLSWIYPFKDFCVISEKPHKINIKNGLLHCENGMSIEYADGFGVYSLNGVRVNKEIVIIPAKQLDPQLLLKEQNAEVRREIVRKIGIDRVYQKLGGETLDKKDNYELVLLKLNDRKRPYLKMLNPSIGVWHIEGVPPEIKSVSEALNWRNKTEEKPTVLT